MEWTRSDVIALAAPKCSHCFGLGLREWRNGEQVPCKCVFRAIFRACYTRWKRCISKAAFVSKIDLSRESRGAKGRGGYGLKNEEFIADFCLVSRRTLGEETLAYKLFKYHYLLGADWKLCARKLGMNRGEIFHECYRIEERLGRTFRELQPFALFPLDEYFGGVVRGKSKLEETHPIFSIETGNARVDVVEVAPLRFPLSSAA